MLRYKLAVFWLEAEIDTIQPEIIFCLGLIAAKTLINKNFRMREQRGKWFKYLSKIDVIATFHPSAISRAIHTQYYDEMKKNFIHDIQAVAERCYLENKYATGTR